MRPAARVALAACAALLLAACGTDDDAGPGMPPLEVVDTLSREVLDNGLEVVVVPRHASPGVLALTAFRAGAFVESPDIDGYSHLLEHMLFKGSADVPDPAEFRRRLRALGALSNATTSGDRVTFYYQLPRDSLDDGLALMAGALRAPQLDAESLAREVDIVLAEFDLVESDWEGLAVRQQLELLYYAYPSRKDPLGQRDVIAAATRDDLLAMHDRYYVPNNALFVLAGDVTPEEGHALAREHLGDWERGEDPFEDTPVPEHPPLDEDVAAIVTAPVTQAELLVAWQGPDTRSGSREAIAAELMSHITYLDDHFLRGVVQAPVVLGAGLDYDRSRHTGAIVLSIIVGLGHEREAVERTRDAIAWLDRPDSFSAAQLRTARDQMWAVRFHGNESGADVAFRLANEWGDADLDFSEDYVDELYALDVGDVRAVVSGYLVDAPKAIVLLTTPEMVEADTLEEGWLEETL